MELKCILTVSKVIIQKFQSTAKKKSINKNNLSV